MITVVVIAVGGLILLSVLAVLVVLMAAYVDTDEPDAAEAPEYDREPRCPTPRLVAGSDLDRHRRPIAAVNADFAALLDADLQLASLRDLDLSTYYVLPEGDR